MNKKLLISLAPLLATAAFAVMPAAAQASPHWFKNGVAIKSTVTELPIVAWGTLTLTAREIGTIECQNVAGGDIHNTGNAPEGVGVDEVERFDPYDCVGVCPEVWKVTGEGLPWPSELIEKEGKLEDKIGTVASPIIIHVECPGLVINTQFKGELTPTTNNGTSALKPSFLELSASSGTLTSELLGPGGAGGKAKVEGYEESEVLAAK